MSELSIYIVGKFFIHWRAWKFSHDFGRRPVPRRYRGKFGPITFSEMVMNERSHKTPTRYVKRPVKRRSNLK